MKIFKGALVVLMILSLNTSFGQEEDSWWRKLFKKDSVEEIEKEVPLDNTNPDENLDLKEIDTDIQDNNKSDTTVLDVKFTSRKLEKTNIPGTIDIHNSFTVDSIAEKFQDKDYRGYRIQIFLGDLDLAKRTRAQYMAKKSFNKCYIEQRAPDYVVLIGDYRDLYEAHQSLFKLKEEFPNAFIVDSEINL